MPVAVPKDCIAVYAVQKSCQNTANPLGLRDGLCTVRWSRARGLYTHPTPSPRIYFHSKTGLGGKNREEQQRDETILHALLRDRHLSEPSKAKICNAAGEEDHKKKWR